MVLTSQPRTEPDRPDVEVLFPEARRFERRRRLITLLAFILVLVLVAIIWISPSFGRTPPPSHRTIRSPSEPSKSIGSGANSTSSAHAVPWVGTIATEAQIVAQQPRPLPARVPPTNATPCSAAQLRLDGVFPTQMMQNDGVLIRFRNTGTTACLLRETPQLVAFSPGHPSFVATSEPLPNYGEVANTKPGASVNVEIEAYAACAANPGGSNQGLPVYRSLTISLPGDVYRVVSGLKLTTQCGLRTTPFFTWTPGTSYAPFNLDRLSPRLIMPKSVRPGTLLVYYVVLSNSSKSSVRLSPCPIYIEHSLLPTKLEYQMNCSIVKSIPSKDHIVYQMKMAIPDNAPQGPITIWWSLDGPSTTPAQGRVRIG